MEEPFIPEPGEIEGEDYFTYNCPHCNEEIHFPDGTDELFEALVNHLKAKHPRHRGKEDKAATRLLRAYPFPESL